MKGPAPRENEQTSLKQIRKRIEHLLLASELKGSRPYAFCSGPLIGAHSLQCLKAFCL